MASKGPKSIYFTEEHQLFRETVRSFMEEQVAPHADDWEREGRIPRDIYRRMGELGFLGVTMPEKYGGSGGDLVFALALLEELPRSRHTSQAWSHQGIPVPPYADRCHAGSFPLSPNHLSLIHISEPTRRTPISY